jgi:outer membrane protein OmpA-like peptidoglycan-associated protein
MKVLSAFCLFLIVSSKITIAQTFITAPFRLCNTPLDEQAPMISPNQQFLFYTIANHPGNAGGNKDPGDIWYSTWNNGEWSAPIHAGSIINNELYNSVLGFSEDGKKIFLSGHYAKNGIIATQGYSFSTKNGSGWSFPENVSIPYFLNRSDHLNGLITPDENIFIFSADSYNTKGAEDIYVSLKKDGKWNEPINLGENINTHLQEWTPYLSEDKMILYFSSNGRGGLGGFDVFTSTRQDDTWTSWSAPKNSDAAINTEGRELFFHPVPNLNVFLYTTTKNSNGYGNIFAIGESLNIRERKDSTVTLPVEKEVPLKKNQMVVRGKISNLKNGKGISATLDFKNDSLYSTTSDSDGSFKIIVPASKSYNIVVNAKGFVNLSEHLDISTLPLNTVEMNFKLQPIEIGTVVNLKSVLFYMGTTALLEESYPELDVVVDFLKSNPKIEIQLEGHTDNRGDARRNQILSQQRVDKIKSYLVSKGIGSRRIKGKGYGGTKPIATSDNEEARKLNRRVEFVIVKD